jgi:predicted anti-sigma-YlaC factor YlaD
VSENKLPRFCREARSQLPAMVSEELAGWPLHVVRAHLRRCADCSAELERQKQLAGALTALRDTHVEPPVGLLDDLLAQASRGGVRQRVAVPARGALSGARPELSVAFLTVGAIASTGIGYGLWRGARAMRRKASD